MSGKREAEVLLDSDVKVWKAKPKYKLVSSLALCSSPRLWGPYCRFPQSPGVFLPVRNSPIPASPGPLWCSLWFPAWGGGGGGLEWGEGSRDWAGALQAKPPSWVWDPGRTSLPSLGPHCSHLTNRDNNAISRKTAL